MRRIRGCHSTAACSPWREPAVGKRSRSTVRSQLDRVQSLLERVIQQTERRVLHGKKVPASEKGLSLFEPQTALIRRGTARPPTEFRGKVLLDEVEGGLVSCYDLLAGNPPDAPQLPTSLEHHQTCFARSGSTGR
jgi:IS5 family transposase